jgi:fatty acid desaturase
MIHFFILINLGSFFITFFNKILGFAQHYGLSNKKELNNYYINCRTIILPKFWSFFYSNMNYHVEHHMYPTVPYYNLKEVHSELIRTQNFPNLSIGWLGLIKDMSKSGMFSFCNRGKKI